MSGTFGEMGNLLKQAQQMQRELDRAREEVRAMRIEGVAGGGAVRVVVDGEGMLHELKIRPELVQGGDHAIVEDAVLAAVRDALGRAHKAREERFGRVAGGLNLPGIM
jgi:nucleoid-associated protein EbfC